ncbi:permease [Terrilactibacillus sp. BCM23-1]|uniref:Permease n=1 Tax=Terrilactibacillus tamarindi TaxID=2599694 RepID=A0A6N8CV56_9BACI|nr:permease [Terrilactibacillus tamarindi]MTT32106.1 permease [Terrilactibacillus tamarindi]
MISQSFLQLNTIFISILIEAIPFVVIGVFISAFIQMFISEKMISRIIPKNRYASVVMGTCMGALFPACECGIVPITERLVKKRVPLHSAIAFMLAGPIINPVVIFATYVAFGNSWQMVIYRCGLAIAVSIFVGLMVSFIFKEDQLRDFIDHKLKKYRDHHDHDHDHEHGHDHHHHSKPTILAKIKGTFDHAVDEFFSVGKYLVFGAFIASAMQTYVKTSTLLTFGDTKVMAILVMIVLAFIMSLCSEADAFVASSFRGTFGPSALSAFLVFGAMVDIKNLIMMLSTFKKRFVVTLIFLITVSVFVGALFIA